MMFKHHNKTAETVQCALTVLYVQMFICVTVCFLIINTLRKNSSCTVCVSKIEHSPRGKKIKKNIFLIFYKFSWQCILKNIVFGQSRSKTPPLTNETGSSSSAPV